MFCPEWVYDIAVSKTAHEFLVNDLPLHAISGKYVAGLSEQYVAIEKDELVDSAERVLHFLAEVDAGEEAATFLNGFAYFRYNFEAVNKPRKLKPMFGAADDPVKNRNYSGDAAVKHFKAYVFALRSSSAPVAPAGWRLEIEENTLHIATVARVQISILDVI